MASRHDRGRWAEDQAAAFLVKQGLILLEKNFRAPGGEIDLIMRDKDMIIFVEVRYRAVSHFATALESVDYKKCERIIKTSLAYLQMHHESANNTCRFDVITVAGTVAKPEIGWIKNAFQA